VFSLTAKKRSQPHLLARLELEANSRRLVQRLRTPECCSLIWQRYIQLATVWKAVCVCVLTRAPKTFHLHVLADIVQENSLGQFPSDISIFLCQRTVLPKTPGSSVCTSSASEPVV